MKQSPKRKVLTEADMRKREKEMLRKVDEAVAEYQADFDSRLQKIKLEAVEDATVAAKALLYRALILAYGFTSDDIANLNQIENDIAADVGSGKYDYDELLDDLMADGVDLHNYYEERNT